MPNCPPYGSPYSEAPRIQQHDASRNKHTGRLANRFRDMDLDLQQPSQSTHARASTHSTFPSMSSLAGALPRHTRPREREQLDRPQRPQFLVVGLFALRITRSLIQHLDGYKTLGSDLGWLEGFLQPYRADEALARLSDPGTIEEYVREYPALVRRMIKQPGYRRIFMEMAPRAEVTERELTDGMLCHRFGHDGNVCQRTTADSRADELRAMIDFADAAGEWGSTVALPARHAARMEELAKGRRMAV